MKTARNGVLYGIAVVLMICLSACAKQTAAISGQEQAIGVVVVSGAQEYPSEKVYADESDNRFTFPMDAACVYFFDADSETSYAGSQNFAGLTFGANIDSDTVGASGQIAYLPSEQSENTVTAYYLYHDEGGIYFMADQPFQTAEVTESLVFVGTDYACSIEFFLCEPAESFAVICADAAEAVLSEERYQISAVEDYQKISLPANTATVDWISYAEDGSELYREKLQLGASSFVICYDDGGQILASKALRLIWPE